jgi:hypothetical protein
MEYAPRDSSVWVESWAQSRAFEFVQTYAEMSWLILPLHTVRGGLCTCGSNGCKSPGKHPRVKNGVHAASNDIYLLNRWWRQWPDANVGIATGAKSKLVVLDVDPRNGGYDSLQQLRQSYGSMDTPLRVVTGGGGWHYYFGWHEGGLAPSTLAPGVEVKGNGQYVVAPPSIHSSGFPYQWVDESDVQEDA